MIACSLTGAPPLSLRSKDCWTKLRSSKRKALKSSIIKTYKLTILRTNKMCRFKVWKETTWQTLRNMSWKFESSRSSSTRRTMKSAIWRWKLPGLGNKLTLKLVNWGKKRRDWEVTFNSKRQNTGNRYSPWRASSTTTSTLKWRT